jgi:hypothetical protein
VHFTRSLFRLAFPDLTKELEYNPKLGFNPIGH